jgi:hypothetical protein
MERQLTKDDDYVDWFKCVATDEDDWMHHKLNHNIEPRVHLYPVQLINELTREEDRWS